MSCVFRQNSRLRKAVLLSLIGHLFVPSFSAGKSRARRRFKNAVGKIRKCRHSLSKTPKSDHRTELGGCTKAAHRRISEVSWGRRFCITWASWRRKRGLLDAHDLAASLRVRSGEHAEPGDDRRDSAAAGQTASTERQSAGSGRRRAIVRVDGRVVGSLPLCSHFLCHRANRTTIALDFPGTADPGAGDDPAGRFAELR